MRNIVLHYHIFKNAGSTIDHILFMNFLRKWVEFDGPIPSVRLSSDELLQCVLARPDLRAISSHLALLPPPSHPEIQFFPILFLRHPIDRVGSAYAFDRRQPEATLPSIRLAKETDLRGYVETTLANEARSTISNFQTLWLSGRIQNMDDAEAAPVDLDLAMRNLAELEFFGLVEEFDKSLELMRIFLGDSFGDLDFEYFVVNKSQDRSERLEDRLQDMRRQLGPSLYSRLLERNALDLALYRAAVRKFNRRYSLLQTRRFFARSFPKDTARGRAVRAVNWRRLELQLAFRRLQMDLRAGYISLGNSGLRVSLHKVTRRFRLLADTGHLAQQMIANHPRTFPTPARASSGDEAREILLSTARPALGRILRKLGMPHDPAALLSELKRLQGEGDLLSSVDHVLALDEFATAVARAPEVPVLQASQLPVGPAAARRRRILFVCSLFPSSHHGGGNRVSNFIKLLSEQNDVYLCTAFAPRHDAASLAELEPYCHSVLQLPAWSFGGNQPAIKNWLAGASMDVVHYEWPDALKNYDVAYGPLQIFTYMEAVSLRLIMDLERLQPMSDPWLRKFDELLRLLRVELVDASPLQARIAVTTKDAEFFRRLYPSQQYTVLNHGITMDRFEIQDRDPEPGTLVYVGNFRHYPNHDAMTLFFEHIWPRITSEIPDARIYVVGAHPPAELLKRAEDPRVIVTGEVEDIRPYIQKATIGVAPLITGAGLRGKVMEYAALRRTFVATSIAVTDLDFEDGQAYERADEPVEFAARVVTLLREPQRARAMGHRAYEVVRDKYDNRRLVGYLNALYGFLEQGQQA